MDRRDLALAHTHASYITDLICTPRRMRYHVTLFVRLDVHVWVPLIIIPIIKLVLLKL